MIPTDSARRGVVESGTSGVSGYQYRSPQPVCRMTTRADGAEHITGYAVVWNRYSANLGGYVEQFRPDAFNESLRNDDQIASYNHEYDMLLGRRSAGTLTLEPDDVGLRYDIAYDAEDDDHRRVRRKIERGELRGSSFTFRWLPDGEEWGYTDEGMLVSTVTRASLLEVAPVVFPAYPATEEADFAVGLRSLAEAEGRDIDELIAAARAGRLTDALRDAPGVSAGGATAEGRPALLAARKRYAELIA